MGMIGNTLAQGLISGANIQDGTVDTADLKDAAVTTAKLADGAVNTVDIADGAVTNAKLASGIDASKLTSGTLPIARIADGDVTAAKLSATAVTDKLGYTPAKSAMGNNPSGGVDANLGNYVGYLDGYGAAVPNSPDGSSFAVSIIQAGQTTRALQIAAPYANNNLYWRNSNDSGYRAWKRVANYSEDVLFNTTRSGEGYLSPMFYLNTGNGYVDLAQDGIYNLKEVSSPGALSAMFNGQLSPYTQSDESMNWQKFRFIFRCTRNSNTYDGINVTFRGVNYFYATGWTETGSTFDFSGTDGERGYRWVVSPWYDGSNFQGGFDVPGFGIKLKTSSISVRIGSVYIQYRR